MLEGKDKEGSSYFGRLDAAVGEDLLHDLVLVAGAELVLELTFAGSVEDALLAVSVGALLAGVLNFHFGSQLARSVIFQNVAEAVVYVEQTILQLDLRQGAGPKG